MICLLFGHKPMLLSGTVYMACRRCSKVSNYSRKEDIGVFRHFGLYIFKCFAVRDRRLGIKESECYAGGRTFFGYHIMRG